MATVAERMRKYRARKNLRDAWLRALKAGLDPYEVMGVTPIGVTARSNDPHADAFDALLAGASVDAAIRIAAGQ